MFVVGTRKHQIMERQMFAEKIRMGTLVPGRKDPANYIRQILQHGFESFSITWDPDGLAATDLKATAKAVKEALAGSGAVISSVSCFGNPLHTDDKAAAARAGFKRLIDAAHLFGCDIVTGFTGRVIDKPLHEAI